MKWFAKVGTIEELRKKYRELLKQHHPDNGGSVELMQEINAEYDRLFAVLSKENKSEEESSTDDDEAENKAFKVILNEIISFNMEIELIGSWIWCFNCYNYRSRLKELGFKFAPKKKAWCWHYGEYKRHYKGQTDLDEVRAKYGAKKIFCQSKKQYSLD